MDILLLRVNEKVTWTEIGGYAGALDSARRAAVEKKKNETDKINSLLSRLLVLSEIERRSKIPRKKIAFRFGTNGKPYLKNGELEFSLSHTTGAVCAAFSVSPDSGEIGVDVERRDRRVNEVMYKRVLSDEEQFHTTSDTDFIRLWVQKEAFLKRLGVGITRDLRGVNALHLPDTTVIDCGGLFIGASGKGALEASVTEITLDDLLNRFTLKL